MSLGSQPVSNFYGPQCRPRVRRLEQLASEAKRPVLPFIFKDLLNGPSLKWKIFKKQDEALDFTKSAKGGLMTFAFEPQHESGRLFLSAHPQVFWHYDVQRPANERSTYEIITENAVCKFYADLEFSKTANPSVDGAKLVNDFIKIIRAGLFQFWKVDCALENILNLDSSNESKFSRHLIFNINFHNNYHVGAFVKNLLQNVDAREKMLVNDSKGGRTLFCDLSVYSKNRHFRLFGSTKKGKNCPLVISEDNRFPITSQLDTFLSTLITNTSEGLVLEWKGDLGRNVVNSSDKNDPSPITHVSTSPYPVLDSYIGKIVHPGRIHSSAYFPASRIIVFSIVGNRFCGNINRQHKRNNVKYVVDLDKYEVYQKCFDVDCQNYRSCPTKLPTEVVFQIEDCSDFVSDDFPSSLGAFEMSNDATVPEESVTTESSLQKFPSFGLSDDAFENLEY